MHLRIALAVVLASLVTTSLARADEEEPAPAPTPATTPTTTSAEPPPLPAPAAPPPAPEALPKKSERDVDHRYEGGVHVGAWLGGEISPVNWFRHYADAAPAFGYDGGYLVNRFFLMGAYVDFVPYSFDRKSGDATIGDGSGWLLSGGFSLKGRFEVNDAFILRGGATVGFNASSQDGKMKDGREFEFAGRGLNLGLNADAVWRASSKVGAVARLAFLTQPLGEATVTGWPTNATAEGETRDFRFAPKIMVSVGPQLFLW